MRPAEITLTRKICRKCRKSPWNGVCQIIYSQFFLENLCLSNKSKNFKPIDSFLIVKTYQTGMICRAWVKPCFWSSIYGNPSTRVFSKYIRIQGKTNYKNSTPKSKRILMRASRNQRPFHFLAFLYPPVPFCLCLFQPLHSFFTHLSPVFSRSIDICWPIFITQPPPPSSSYFLSKKIRFYPVCTSKSSYRMWTKVF